MLMAIISLIFCLSLCAPRSASGHAFEWHGHRGARGLYPENTIHGMREALKYPITTLEMDLVITGDNQVLVSHDPYMNSKFCLTPQGEEISNKINIFKLSADKISQFDCGSKYYKKFPRQQKVFESKPLLKNLLTTIAEENAQTRYSFEIKSSRKAEEKGFQPPFNVFTDLAIKEILKVLPVERFIIQSFDTRVLSYLRQKYPQIKIVLLRGLPFQPSYLLKSLNFTPDYISPDYRILCKSSVDYFHQHGIKVIPFTINNKKTFQRMKKMDVDGILTDYPDLISDLSLP